MRQVRSQLLSTPHLVEIITAVICGTMSRIATLREDYRQYPTFPNGYLNQVVMGFVAALLGAVMVPAIMTGNFTAVTFLALAIRQFQAVRQLEQKSLLLLEDVEYTHRGHAYIDGISKTFEARNYSALSVALVIGIIMEVMEHNSPSLRVIAGIAGGICVFVLLSRMTKGQIIADLAEVTVAQIHIRNHELYVDGMFVSNRVGIERGQEMLITEGMAVMVKPKHQHFRVTLDNFGQRQAILFELTRGLGVKRYHYMRKNYDDGRIAFAIVPIIRDEERMIQIVRHTPVLETSKKTHSPLRNWVNRHE